jgi:3,4-dihydroxy 2-butanone 4-phosphate synthase/GTP cyclohydrolase II
MGSFASIERAVEEIAAGRMVVVVDDEDRENEGDLIMAADLVTPEAINFMATHARGLICVALAEERLARLALAPMVARSTAVHDTAFTVSVDLLGEGRTGISAFDRSDTIAALCDPATAPGDLARPGHVFPLAVRAGGVLARAGHTEAAHDLARMAGRTAAGVLVEVLSADGTMARRPELERFAAAHGLVMISVAQLIEHRRRAEREGAVARTASAQLPTRSGPGAIKTYTSAGGAREVVAVVTGALGDGERVLTRVHSECLTGDVLGSTRCDCGDQLREAQALIAAEGRGVLLYVRGDEGRGIGLTHKVRAYALQDQGYDTVDANIALGFPADARTYDAAAAVLADLGVRSARLLTNNPDKCAGLEAGGIRVAERVALGAHATADNLRYLSTKRDRMGHLLEPLPPARAADGAPAR